MDFNAIDPAKAKDYFQNKMAFSTGPAEVKHVLDEAKADSRPTLIDVRASEDFARGHIPGAINLPEDQWPTLLGLTKEKTNVIYCYSAVCHLAAKAALGFAEQGFPVMEMDGGFAAWKDNGYKDELSESNEAA